MKRIGLKAESSVSVIEFMTAFKHRFTEETYVKKGDTHNFPEIIYSLDNNVYVTVDDKDYTIKAGEMFIYAPKSYHMITRPVNATVLIVSFVPGYEKISRIYNKVIPLDNEIRIHFINTIEELAENTSFSVKDGIPELRLKDGVPQILKEIIKVKFEAFLLMLEQTRPDIFENHEKFNVELSSVIENLKNNISSNYTIGEMAKVNMMSESKLKNLFRKYLNTSPISYFHKMKIDYAKVLLIEGEKNITEVAEELGFQSIHYFSRFFKKHTGTCPTEYSKAIDKHAFL